jgi:4-amino-4-deoxy-L-arabinose transferase-like glycosyltransferase
MEQPSPPPPNADTPTPPRAYWLLAGFLVLGLVLRLPLLGRSVWFDEACMSNQRIGTWEQLLATIYVDIHPPLYITFMHFWNGVFGDGEVSMRLPPLLTGLAAIPLMFWAGRPFVGDTGSLWGALLLALSPVHVWYSAEARLYAPMVFCTLVAVGTFVRLATGRTARARLWWTVHVVNLAVMLALHYYLAVYVVVLAVLAPVAARGWTRSARTLVLVHGVGILLLGAFVLGKRALGEFETAQDYMRALTVPELWKFVFDWCWTGHTLLAVGSRLDDAAAYAQEALGIVLIGAGLWQLARLRRDNPLGLFVPVLLLAIPALLFSVSLFGLGKTYIERSCLPALPFVFLLAGAGLTSLPRRSYLPVCGGVLLLGTASLIAFFRHAETEWTVYKPHFDWRGAAAYLSAEIDAGAAGRPVFTSTPNARPLSYYDVRIQDVKSLAAPMKPEEIGEKVRRRLGDSIGNYAERTFRAFAAHNEGLLNDAALRIYPSAGDPAQMDLKARMRDDVCYLVRDEWHPNPAVDHTIEDLVKPHPRVTVLDKKVFVGITVYKVRIAP